MPGKSELMLGNRYQIYESLGRGGMGAVFRAKDRLTGDYVALKRVALPGHDMRLSFIDQDSHHIRLALAREFEILATMRHPNIISVLDYGFDETGTPFFTMELLLDAVNIVHAAQTRTTPERVQLLMHVLQALRYLHQRGILHRDIKPDNVLVDEGRVRLLDFGLSTEQRKDTSTGGTLGYMAPEVIRGNKAVTQSDLYAVGIIAYQIFAGELPFRPGDIRSIISEPPDMAGVKAPPPVVDVIHRLLLKNPEDRYATAYDALVAFAQAIDEEPPPDDASIRESFLQAAAFVGREDELNRLLRVLSYIQQPPERGVVTGGTFLIAGESGVGKSRLLEEFRIRATIAGLLVLRGYARENNSYPYQIWQNPIKQLILAVQPQPHEVSLLARIVPDIQAFVDDTGKESSQISLTSMQQRLIVTIADLIQRSQSPVILIMEDLHWAEEGLDVLRRLTRLSQVAPLMIVGTYRSDAAPYLYGKLPDAQLIQLDRFTPKQLKALSVAILGAVGEREDIQQLLMEQSEGNAFFAIEIIRALSKHADRLANIADAPLPGDVYTENIFDFARRRIERLPVDFQPMLRLAAVIGREIDFDLLETIDDEMDYGDWLGYCADAALLDVVDGQWVFAHNKLREGILADLPPAQRANLHRTAAEGIEQVYGQDEQYILPLARHWSAAGVADKSVHYGIRGMRQLIEFGRFAEALVWVERVREVFKHHGNLATFENRMMVYFNEGEAYRYLSQYEKAAEAYVLCDEMAAKIQNDAMQAAVFVSLSQVFQATGDYESALLYARSALDVHMRHDDPNGIARSSRAIGRILAQQGDYTGSITHLEQALDIWEVIGDEGGIPLGLLDLGIANRYSGDYDLAYTYLDQSAFLFEQVGDQLGVATAFSHLGLVASYLQNPTAEKFLRRSIKLFDAIGSRNGRADALYHMGIVHLRQQAYQAAYEAIAESLSIYNEIGDIPGVVAASSALTLVMLGMNDMQAAQELMRQSLPLAQNMRTNRLQLHVLCIAVNYAHATGNLQLASRWAGLILKHPHTARQDIDMLQPLLPAFDAAIGQTAFETALHAGEQLTPVAALVEVASAVGT